MMTLITRELLTTLRHPQSIFQPILFFALTMSLFPLALGADNDTLQRITPAALWIALLLAALLSGEQLFSEDFRDGTLSQDCLHVRDLWQLLLAKLLSSWLRFTLPLLLIFPLLALMFHIPARPFMQMALLVLIGSIPLLLIGTLGAVLTLSQQNSTFLRFLIVVPLYVPILIIGVTAAHDALLGLVIRGQVALLGALTLFSLLTIIPFGALAIKSQPLP